MIRILEETCVLVISGISRDILIPVYRYGTPDSGAQKRKYTSLYTDSSTTGYVSFKPL